MFDKHQMKRWYYRQKQQFQMKITKCTIDLTRCDYYDTYKMTNICSKLIEKNALWSKYVSAIQPPLDCPIPAGEYQMINGTSDMTLAARLPIDGNRWLTSMKLFETVAIANTDKTRQEQVWCLDNDVRITLSKNSRKRKKN